MEWWNLVLNFAWIISNLKTSEEKGAQMAEILSNLDSLGYGITILVSSKKTG